MNTAPPFCPAIYGNRHTLPSPTAEPAVASITPSLLPKLPLSIIVFTADYADISYELCTMNYAL